METNEKLELIRNVAGHIQVRREGFKSVNDVIDSIVNPEPEAEADSGDTQEQTGA